MQRIFVTGATGFIGQYLLKELPKRGYRVRVLLRRPTALPKGCPSAVIGDLARPYNMAEALAVGSAFWTVTCRTTVLPSESAE